MELPLHVTRNRRMLERTQAEYESLHARDLARHQGMAWGDWRRPESDLRVLGDVTGKHILELGCGAARWSIALAHLGAHPTGIDISQRQLVLARRLQAQAGVAFPLVEANAETLPFPDAAFDVVFSDWGAPTFCDPYCLVPEVARALRPGGLFAFCGGTPWLAVCEHPISGHIGRRLARPYHTLHRLEWPDQTQFQLSYGAWIRLFRSAGLSVEDLIELSPPPRRRSSYFDGRVARWARSWPLEHIWKLRKVESSHGTP